MKKAFILRSHVKGLTHDSGGSSIHRILDGSFELRVGMVRQSHAF